MIGARQKWIGMLTRQTFTILLIVIIVALWVVSVALGTEEPEGAPSLSALIVALLLVVGLLAGLLGGLIGTGGCSVMLPILHFWLGYSAPVAIGTTLFAVIFTATSGGYGHLVRRNIDKRATLLLGAGGIVGVILGSWLFTLLADDVALLGLILGLAFLFPAIRMIVEGGLKKGSGRQGDKISGSRSALGGFGALIGILTGVVGLGGGYALVPGLIYLFGAPVYITMGTSLSAMIPLALIGGGIKLAEGWVALGAGLLLAGGTIIGAQTGAAIIRRFKPTTLKLIFGAYFLFVSLKFITAFFGIAIF
ncbi:MAG: sulfite exporter TauE/SafE family protein [Thermoplasmata archaeon]